MAGGGPVPPGIDITRPNVARVYNAFLDGKDNFAADRAVVESALQIAPDSAGGAKSNRAFLRRVVRYLAAEAGITQFLDIGSGLPSAGNVHEVARDASPRARAAYPGVRVVYVDNDPVVGCTAGRCWPTRRWRGSSRRTPADRKKSWTIPESGPSSISAGQSGC